MFASCFKINLCLKKRLLTSILCLNAAIQGHDYSGVAEFESGSSVNYSFSNFSFKVIFILVQIF